MRRGGLVVPFVVEHLDEAIKWTGPDRAGPGLKNKSMVTYPALPC